MNYSIWPQRRFIPDHEVMIMARDEATNNPKEYDMPLDIEEARRILDDAGRVTWGMPPRVSE